MPTQELFLEIEKMGANAGNFRPHKALLFLLRLYLDPDPFSFVHLDFR